MRALKIATIVMGVLIVLGTTALIIAIVRRHAAAPIADAPAASIATNLDAVLREPAGTRIAGIAALQDRLAIQLQGGGADRVVLVDPRSGVVTGHIHLGQ